ncbi:MAG: flagellar hook-associated protein FlgK [Clostridiaceae bacterium]
MSGLFGTLNIGKSGIFTHQKAIDVTSHNIANANTEGYSRQRAEMQTRRPFSTPGMNTAAGAGQMGTGSIVSQVNRVRDTFLDYRVREELGTLGQYSGRDKFLREIENIFNEPTDTGISSLIGKFFDAWHELSKQSNTSNARTVVAEQSKALADQLNRVYNQLQNLKENAQESIKQTVVDVNSMIDQINKLNEEIVQVSVSGQMPNDLMDRRDLLIDELSTKFGIKIEKKGLNSIDISTKSDPNAKPPGNLNIVQGTNPDDVLKFAYVSEIKPGDGVEYGKPGTYKLVYYKNGDMTSEENRVEMEIEITDDDKLSAKEKLEQLDECRVIWTNKNGEAVNKEGKPIGGSGSIDDLATFTPSNGELKGYMSVQNDIDINIEKLNKLARSLAFSVNAIHSQSAGNYEDELLFFMNKDGKEEDITAGNICINPDILENVMLINTGTEIAGEGDGKRAVAIAALKDKLMEIQSMVLEGDGKHTRESFINELGNGLVMDDELGVLVLKGSTGGMKTDNYFKNIVNTLGVQAQESKRMVEGQYSVLMSFQESRYSVSGVSLDEEMTNMIQFQHAYQASAKIVATVDELLDVIINGLKR